MNKEKMYYRYHFLTTMVLISKSDIDKKLWCCSQEGLVITLNARVSQFKCKSVPVQILRVGQFVTIVRESYQILRTTPLEFKN